MTTEEKRNLESKLWAAANSLRGSMSADQYKDYLLGLIFYKYLSEKQETFANKKLAGEGEEYNTFEKIAEKKEYISAIKKASQKELGYFLEPKELFTFLVKKGNKEIENSDGFILEDLKNILQNIENTSKGTDSEDDFKGLFRDMDFSSTKLGKSEKQKNQVIVEVMTSLGEIDFKLGDTKSDIIGDAYEYLIAQFASGAGKKGGEFYTPGQISTLLSKIVSHGKDRIKSVYDPACGSGSLLLKIGKEAEVINYYGQEINSTTHNLARMNMILHDIHFNDFDIRQDDTLTNDLFPDLRAEAIVANPPFSLKWKSDSDSVLAADDRFTEYGALAPKNRADYAFVTHMLYHLADNGTMAVVLPHGVLFTSGANETIRKHIIENQNSLDAVIGLPSNLFFGVGIPVTILVFKKNRTEKDILFIDASKEFEKGKNQNTLTDENVEKIFKTYIDRVEIEKNKVNGEAREGSLGYSHRASLEEIKENDFNLNIPRYVDTFEEEEEIDITEVAKNLQNIQKGEKEIQKNIAEFCDELGIEKPF